MIFRKNMHRRCSHGLRRIGWPFTIPAPAVGIIWALIDAAVCHYFVLNAVYYLVESTLLMTLNVVLGTMIFIVNRYVARWTPRTNYQLSTLSVGLLLALLRSYQAYSCWLSVSCTYRKRVPRYIGKEELI